MFTVEFFDSMLAYTENNGKSYLSLECISDKGVYIARRWRGRPGEGQSQIIAIHKPFIFNSSFKGAWMKRRRVRLSRKTKKTLVFLMKLEISHSVVETLERNGIYDDKPPESLGSLIDNFFKEIETNHSFEKLAEFARFLGRQVAKLGTSDVDRVLTTFSLGCNREAFEQRSHLSVKEVLQLQAHFLIGYVSQNENLERCRREDFEEAWPGKKPRRHNVSRTPWGA